MKNPSCELTNMIMIQNPSTGEVVVINRKKSWTGLSFPGGHVEPGESFYDSAVREAYEETGLEVKNLELCGIINWSNTKTFDRYLYISTEQPITAATLFREPMKAMFSGSIQKISKNTRIQTASETTYRFSSEKNREKLSANGTMKIQVL